MAARVAHRPVVRFSTQKLAKSFPQVQTLWRSDSSEQKTINCNQQPEYRPLQVQVVLSWVRPPAWRLVALGR